ncbi:MULTISPECIES: hypothetical protein [Paenibacillus]|uniref:hypothetical protein n=1 Tax=Paenibacillus TaxID=44249 RepID=UPI0011DD77E1|nr:MULTISPECIES: hypothetical protein [Paenibacillus]MDU4697686.1 hypothetical protein [Paenibacillus sp.]
MSVVLRKSSALRSVALTKKLRSKSKRSIAEIEKLLGLDKIEPMKVTMSDAKDMENDMEYFKGWYEDELRKILKQQ